MLGHPIVAAANPVVFTGSEAAGTEKVPDGEIRNQSSVGMNVHRLVISVSHETASLLRLRALPLVRIRYQNEPITNGFVPISAVTYPLNAAFAYCSAETFARTYVLHLERPVWLGPNEFFNVSFQSTADISGIKKQIVAAAVGSQAPARPRERYLPYLTAFASALSGTDIDQVSDTSDLGNPFDRDLFVPRLICPVALSFASDDSALPGGVRMTITDDTDTVWARQVNPRVLFSPIDCSWRVRTTLAPKKFLRLVIDGSAAGQVGPWPVGLVGYRRIS